MYTICLGSPLASESEPLLTLFRYNEIVAMSVACSYGHQDCQNKAQVLFKQWMSNNSSNP